MLSTKTIELMDLEEAMKNKNLLGGELENISKNQEENVAALTGMLYSIPKSVTKNRDIHKMFLEDSFNDDIDDLKSDKESLSIEGQKIRDILAKKKKGENNEKNSETSDEEGEDEDNEYSEDEDSEDEEDSEDDEDYDEDDDELEEDIVEGKDVNAEKKEIVSEYTTSINESEEENSEEGYNYYKNTQEDENDEEDEEPSEEKIIELISELATKMKAKGESKENIKKCVAVLLLMLLADYDNLDLYEDDMEDLIDDLYENDLNSQNGEENPKEVTIADAKKSKKDSEKSTWQDASNMNNDEKAKDLREKARAIATQGTYGMATKDGIQKLSELLNELLKYSSGPFGKNKPIAELVRNFNSIKAIESQLVGNEKNLKIVASEEDLQEVAKSAENPKEARMLRLSMEQTYADKIRALDRFKYSEKVETMIRNALFDLYENAKVKVKKEENGNYVYEEKLENEKAINTGKILLPLLRTKNEPKDYNYDFQYDVLREMIRQEEFYDENHDNDPFESSLDKINDNKKVEVNSVGIFAILRYLKTILNYTGTIGNTNDSANDLYSTESFKTNFAGTLSKIINGTSSTDDDTFNYTSNYQKYIYALQKFTNNNEKLKQALSKTNEIIFPLYDKTKESLKNNNKIDLSKLRTSLGELSKELNDSNRENIIIQLNEKISKIASAISGNFLNLESILNTCGYNKKEIASIKSLCKIDDD